MWVTSLGLAGEAGIFASRPFYPMFSGVPNGPLRLSPPQVSIFQSKDEPEVGFELRKADRWCEELLSETVAMVEWGGGLGGGGS